MEHFAPFARDVVIAGPNRDDIGVLIFPDLVACRRLAPECPADTPAVTLLSIPRVVDEFRFLLTTFAKTATGSSTRVARAALMSEPPSLDAGEITDKGSINQRAVLGRRAALVEDLYRQPPPEHVIVVSEGH
jgi:feruloyl-CoA synthase